MNRLRPIAWAECGIAVLATALALQLHWTLFHSAGALWRDEIGIINIALLPSFHEIWDALFHDHCPLFFPFVIRGWATVTGSASDVHFQALGFGIALCLLAMCWMSTRTVGKSFPALSLALFALNATVIFFGDSIRAYGLATTLSLLTFCLTWRFVAVPNLRRGLVAGVAAVLAVQTLYTVAFLVLAIGAGGIAVCLYRRAWKAALGVLAIGLAAAVSLVPYVGPIVRSQSWWDVSKQGDTLPNFVDQVFNATGADEHIWSLYAWFIVVCLALALGILFVISRKPSGDAASTKEPVLFCTVVLAVTLAGYAEFFYGSKMFPQPWYFIPLLGVSAVCSDIILGRIHGVVRFATLATALVTLIIMYPQANAIAHQRRTDIDLVAAEVSRAVDPADLVIVSPWHYGLTFNRYYVGKAPVTTLPVVAEMRFHRYDLIRDLLQTNSAEPVLQWAGRTLSSGHRLWIVGDFQLPDPKKPLEVPQFVPLPGQKELSYNMFWSAQLVYFVTVHATNHETVALPLKHHCNPLENIGGAVFSGWQDAPAPAK